MARLPRLPRGVPLFEAGGQATKLFQSWWQAVIEALEGAEFGVDDASIAGEVLQSRIGVAESEIASLDKAPFAPLLPTADEAPIDIPLCVHCADRVANALTLGTGLAFSFGAEFDGSIPLELENTAPDQTVTLTSGGGCTITGTYPNFTITVP